MFTRNRVIMSHNIKTPLTSISRAVGNILQLKYDQLIKSLFSNGEQGFFYDPNDLSTMFQDSAGTVPVTGVGQPVGLIRDKSGRNNHAYQTNSTSRPTLRQNATTGANYLEFDGSDDFLRTNNIDFTATDKVSLFAGVRKLSDVVGAVVIELSASITNTGTFLLQAPMNSSIGNYGVRLNGNVVLGFVSAATLNNYPSPTSNILTAKMDISAQDLKEVTLRTNAANTVYNSTPLVGTGNFGNYPLFIGRRAGTTLAFNGHLYSLIGIGRLTSDSETIALEKAIAKNVGVTLNV